MKRRAAARAKSDELSAWVRGINRRILVESLSAEPSVPTLQWLAGCISKAALERLEEEVRNGADESATVLAFIAALATLSRSLDEKISKTTKSLAEVAWRSRCLGAAKRCPQGRPSARSTRC